MARVVCGPTTQSTALRLVAHIDVASSDDKCFQPDDPTTNLRMWGHKTDVDNLVGAFEMAQRLKSTTPHTAHVGSLRYKDLPSQIAKPKTALICDRCEIEAWGK
jgi:hypothetical protein